jgi:thiol-disulfide isomerase/thioredoxin
VFLNIWATWCKPCREEMPAIVRAMNAIGDTSIHFIFASPEPASDVIPFTKEHSYDVDYAIILNAYELNVSALPTTIIFNSSGKIVFSEAGYRDWGKPQNVDLIKKMIK